MKMNMAIFASAVLITSAAAQAPVRKPATAKAAVNAGTSKFKAIWEPVPFNKDIDLNDIACVGPETCWAVGAKSTILATKDGGKTWQVQLGGDPESTDDPFTSIFLLDATHGWVMTDRAKILSTRDGNTWTELTKVSGTSKGVWFVSPETGLEIENPSSTVQTTLRRSEDGGKTWNDVSQCSVDATVDGLPRKLGCMVRTVQFLSPTLGFAGGSATLSMAAQMAAFGRTTDGGQTWTMSVIPESKRSITDLHFWTEKDGIVVLDRGEEVHWTADAGATWTRSTKQRLWPSYYGVGAGKIIVGIGESNGIGYSLDGGRTFSSREFKLPAAPMAVTFPDAEHGYVVGQHAMVYRYRVVPADYASPGMLAAAGR